MNEIDENPVYYIQKINALRTKENIDENDQSRKFYSFNLLNFFEA